MDSRPPRFSYHELRLEAERELMLRRRVYPNRVVSCRMTAMQCKHRIELMQAIIDVLAELEKSELLPLV